ncbi:MAG: glutathione S-transferase family protein [Steroidobacteraceae bacterium]|nr:glutathione S-transferase family protein [Nevskiaceae bacterium]MCP5339886.1 glutathione S-transferase family protein [Nevskiaceae bacterium]MCP5360821.1 glutathione S-transferase family protein [Nevskiaceae bacterium]MCP5466907.1 glutathione S-transferase family protein [Nevskiaceae bacterium]MCP5470996.1 glutathione S-transferase family protein [Nevskiaceae bacterium]
MKLYGSLASPYVARAVLTARYKGIDLKPEPAPGGGIKSAEFLALNPMGKMPALEVDGKYLAESMVIVEYIEDSHPQKPVLPQDPLQRAHARLLARIVDLYVAPQSGPFFRNMNPANRNETEVEAGKKALGKALADLEHFMDAQGPWANGAAYSLADIAMLPSLLITNSIVSHFGITDLFTGLPKLGAWWKHCHSDPLTAGFIAEYLAALQAFLASRRG